MSTKGDSTHFEKALRCGGSSSIVEQNPSAIATLFAKDSGARLGLLPNRGGMLNQLAMNVRGKTIDIIAGVKTSAELEINPEYRGVPLFPFANRLANGRYTFAGHSYQFPINECQNGHAIHGFLHRLPARVSSQCPKSSSLALQYSYLGQFEYYPFPFEAQMTYRFVTSSQLVVTFSALNTGKQAMPVGFGWHPYFTLGEPVDDLSLKLFDAEQVGLDDRCIPFAERRRFNDYQDFAELGKTHLDDCFHILASSPKVAVSLWSKQQRIGVEVWQTSHKSGGSYFQICTSKDRQSIAIEPMTSNIDAFNNHQGLTILKPGKEFSCEFGVKMIDKKE